ncbi:MAG: ABC transporter substrate-binding protein [Sulfitobacter sp.]
MMPHAPRRNRPISRRVVLTRTAASAAALAIGLPSSEVESGPVKDGVDQMVAKAVRRKFPSFPRALSVLIPNGSAANLKPLVMEFEKQTNVKVRLSEADIDGINAELLLDIMLDGRKYDVALAATFGLSDLVLAQAVEPLDSFQKLYEPDGFRDGILFNAGDHLNGSTFGFQTDGDAYLMFYNNQMLKNSHFQKSYQDKFGVELDVPLTWSELDRQMAFFHDPDNGRFGGSLFRTPMYVVWEFWLRFHAKGVWPFSPDMVPQIQGDTGAAALEEMMQATRYLIPGVEDHGVFRNWERYSEGDIYANIGWGGTQKYLNGPKSSMRGKMSFGPTPGGQFGDLTVPMPYFNWGWNYVVSRTSTAPELAYLFCLFASSPVMSTCAVRQVDGFFDPFRPEHYADPGIVDAYSGPFLNVQRAALEGAIPDLYIKRQSEYFGALAEGLDQAFQGQAAPQVALARVAQKWELITSHTGRAGQISQWQQLRSQYPAAVRNVLHDLS